MANKFARTAGGNWTTDATWSTTSGGAADTVAPTASDDVFLDANSGNVTISATSVGKSLDCTGYTGTLTHNTGISLTLSGNLTFVAGMTYTPSETSVLAFNVDSTITSAGKLITRIQLTGTNADLTLGDNLSFAAYKTCQLNLVSSGTTVVLNGKTISGNSSTNRVLILSNTIGSSRTITNTTGTFANADFRDITLSSAADLSAITGLSGDCGGNTNITFTTAATQTYTGGTGSWSDVTKWTSRVPLPQDDVSMAGVTGGTITADMPRLGKSIDWTGASGTPTWASTISNTVYGSVTHISSMATPTMDAIMVFEGRSSFTLTSAGKTINRSGITIQMVGGTLTLSDASVISAAIGNGIWTLSNGTFNTGSFNLTTPYFSSSNSNTRVINLGSSTITLTGSDSLASPWNCQTSTNLTVNAGTSTIVFTDLSTTSKTFAGGGKTYYDLKCNTDSTSGTQIITNSNTFNRIYTDGGGTKSITLPGSATTTILSGQGLNNGTNVITFTASAGSATVAKSGGGTVGWDYVNLTNIPASTANTWYAGTHSTDGGGNTNWSFTAVPILTGYISVQDLKDNWLIANGYTTGTLDDKFLKYFNTLNSSSYLSLKDAMERRFLNLGYSGTVNDMYRKSMLSVLSNPSQANMSIKDLEEIFYATTSNTFA